MCCSNLKDDDLYTWSKWFLYFYNFIFQLVGVSILALGIYSEIWRSKFTDAEHFFTTPAVFLIILGITVFSFATIGSMAALWGNICLLYLFISLAVICIALEVGAGVAALVFKDPAKNLVNDYVMKGLITYYDDQDLKNLVDFVQVEFQCCGGRMYKDWEINPYHNCSAPGPSACGVPFSCCIPDFEVDYVINSMCGYETLDLPVFDAVKIIYVYGCIDAVIDFFWINLDVMAGLLLAIFLPQISGIILGVVFLDVLKRLVSRFPTQPEVIEMKNFDPEKINMLPA